MIPSIRTAMYKVLAPFLGILASFYGPLSNAQVTTQPKIGLVLSGGGAKGMAHIGALKVIEKAGVKIDYIGGTSMGAIIGALYASGYSADQLDSLFRATDFGNLIKDNLPRGAKAFYEKEDSERYALTLPFDKFRISVPQAYSGGQNIYNELVRVLYHVRDIDDFSQLPIPFVCIATDIENGQEVVLNSGYLPEAVMASGTLPSLFQPTAIDGRVLIDGGVVNNYPIEEVKKMGADIIIGVDVQHGLSDKETLSSATDILLQINNYRTAGDMLEKIKKTDIYLKPQMNNFSVIDFNQADKIIKLGETAAIQKFQALKKIGNKELQNPKPIQMESLQDSILINALILQGENSYKRGYIKGKLRFNVGEKITFTELQQGISNLSATGNFDTNRYKLLSNGQGNELIMRLKESKSTNFLRIGAHYDDLYKSAALLNVSRKNALLNGDVASFDLILGDKIRYNFEYYWDNGSYWSFGVNSRFNQFNKEINYNVIQSNFDVPNTNVSNISLDVSDVTNQLYLQTFLKEEFIFTVGAEQKFLNYSTRTLANLAEAQPKLSDRESDGRVFFEKSSFYSAFGSLKLDTYDDKYFPTNGLYFDGDFHYYVLSSDFNDNFKDFSVSKARMGAAITMFKNVSLNVEAEGGFKLGISKVKTFDFVLGGYGTDLINNFIPFYGYDFLSLTGNSFVKAYGRIDYEFARNNHFMFLANFSNVEDDIFRTGEWFTWPNYSGYGIGYGWESFVGPIQVIYSWSPEVSRSNLFLSLGFWF